MSVTPVPASRPTAQDWKKSCWLADRPRDQDWFAAATRRATKTRPRAARPTAGHLTPRPPEAWSAAEARDASDIAGNHIVETLGTRYARSLPGRSARGTVVIIGPPVSCPSASKARRRNR